MKTFNGYKKKNLTDSNLLLAGSGHKPLNELLTDLSRPTNTDKISITVGGNTLLLDLGARAWDSTAYLPLSGGIMTGHITMSGLEIYFGKSGVNAILSYNSSYPKYGIWYNDTTVDLMMFSASGNADDASKADLAINGNGDGTVTIRGNTIVHSGNISSYIGSNVVKFYLSPLEANAPASSAKSWFADTMPSGSGAIVYNVPGSEKTIIAGKSSGAYGHMLQLNYDDTYLRILRYYQGSWKASDWEKISAGYADSAGSVAWGNVSGKPAVITNPYTGHFLVTGRIFGYNYGNQGSNVAAFMWDKPGANYTGVGAHGVSDEIYFSACDANGNWVTSYKLRWIFNGGIYADSLNGCTPAYQGYDNNFINHSNEFTAVPNGYSGEFYINYRTTGGLNGNISNYKFCRGAGESYANVTAANFYASSDRAKKKNIRKVSEHISKFTLKDTNKDAYGVIAQEVPEMFRDGEEGSMTVNYNSVLSYYVGILENKVKDLEDKIKLLENKN